MSEGKAVVLVSGGLDSLIALMIVRETHHPAALHVSYGQRTEARELRAFEAITDHLEIEERLVVRHTALGRMGGSSLTDGEMQVPTEGLDPGIIPNTYVPFRNGNLLSIGVSWAEVIGAEAIVIGAVEADSSGYPDCRVSFFNAFQAAVIHGTRPDPPRITILTPVIGMSKTEIVQKGAELGAPFHLSWSCYSNDRVPCGLCDSCRLRERAFSEAGIKDPIT